MLRRACTSASCCWSRHHQCVAAGGSGEGSVEREVVSGGAAGGDGGCGFPAGKRIEASEAAAWRCLGRCGFDVVTVRTGRMGEGMEGSWVDRVAQGKWRRRFARCLGVVEGDCTSSGGSC